MRTTTLTCDGCQHDIQYKSNSVEYRLVLSSESKDMRPGMAAYTDMGISPSIDQDKHFCGLFCLGVWLLRERPKVIEYAISTAPKVTT
jgi:hypothetical protein